MNIEWISRRFSTTWAIEFASWRNLRSISLRDMEQIFPNPVDEVDVASLYRSDDRVGFAQRPWVMCNMISTTDGAVAVDGVSGGLGGPGDKEVFTAIRGVADVIVVASGTAVAENYRSAQTRPEMQRRRVEAGQSPVPRIAIVTQSLAIDPDHRVFDGSPMPFIITSASSPTRERAALASVAEIIIAGDDRVDLALALGALADRGASVVLLEGGPTLNGAFVDADLIDELCLSCAPLLLGGASPRIVAKSTNTDPLALRLDRTLHDSGYLFHRYLRDR